MEGIIGLNGEALTIQKQFQEMQKAGFAALTDLLNNHTTDDEVRLKACIFALTLRAGG